MSHFLVKKAVQDKTDNTFIRQFSEKKLSTKTFAKFFSKIYDFIFENLKIQFNLYFMNYFYMKSNRF